MEIPDKFLDLFVFESMSLEGCLLWMWEVRDIFESWCNFWVREYRQFIIKSVNYNRITLQIRHQVRNCLPSYLPYNVVNPTCMRYSMSACTYRIRSEHHLRRVIVRQFYNVPRSTMFYSFDYLQDAKFGNWSYHRPYVTPRFLSSLTWLLWRMINSLMIVL